MNKNFKSNLGKWALEVLRYAITAALGVLVGTSDSATACITTLSNLV